MDPPVGPTTGFSTFINILCVRIFLLPGTKSAFKLLLVTEVYLQAGLPKNRRKIIKRASEEGSIHHTAWLEITEDYSGCDTALILCDRNTPMTKTSLPPSFHSLSWTSAYLCSRLSKAVSLVGL